MANDKKVTFIMLIAERKQKKALLEALSQIGIRLTNTIYGKGTAKGNFFTNMLGLVPEKNKVVITCLTTDAKSDAVLKLVVKEFNFDKPNTGIAFTLPVEGISS